MGEDELDAGTEPATYQRYREAHRLAARTARHQFPRMSPEDRDELVNDVLIKYFRRFGREDQPDHDGWIVRTVRTTGIDRLRQQRPVHPVGAAGDGVDPLSAFLAYAQAVTETPSLAAGRGDLLARVLNLVSDREARLLQLRHLDNLPARAAADVLGMAPAAVDQAARRARQALATALSQHPELVDELRAAHPRVYGV